ncbi:F0F1 ATP synthase subunit gamma [Sulfuriferula thiophila]|uniref:F0F1 ATP synthase subunit gamma n=1 Tax=Sulfuriferula thiophila TaxID=1781211 RepID=UPI001CB90EDA|nr:F0F1 ATP synthase subunit gamma [Sulfuriferula thiophila]
MCDVFGNVIDHQPEPLDVAWRSMHNAPLALMRRSTQSEFIETGIKAIDGLVSFFTTEQFSGVVGKPVSLDDELLGNKTVWAIGERVQIRLEHVGLAAMQRAEKNIDELLVDLNLTYHRLRQSGIDAELFDVISGFEALTKHKNKPHD